ncbi:MAG: hypothetical protein ACLP2F_00665 [Steroidobacteraceae bacterium]
MLNPRDASLGAVAAALCAAALCTIAALSGCHRDSSHAPQRKPAAQQRAPVAASRGPTAEELTKDMVEAASQGKSQVPVALKFDLLQRPTVGQPLQIAIALMPQIPASPATIAVAGSDGLQLAPGEDRIEIPSVDAAQVYRYTIKVTPTAEGVLLLRLTVNLKHDEMTDSRIFAVPIIVETSAPGAASPTNAATPANAANPANAASQTR